MSVKNHLKVSLPYTSETECFSSLIFLMLSDSDKGVVVPLVWDWCLHYAKCSREFFMLYVNEKVATDTVILSLLDKL